MFITKYVAINQQILQNVNQSWQTLANPANTVDYSSHLLSATLPISIQHFLKYSESIKKESSALSNNGIGNGTNGLNGNSSMNSSNLNLSGRFAIEWNILTIWYKNRVFLLINWIKSQKICALFFVIKLFSIISLILIIELDLLGGLKNGIAPNLNLALNQVNNIAMQSSHQHHSAQNLQNHHTNSVASNTSSTTAANANNLTNHAAEIIERVATSAVILPPATTNGKKTKKKKAPKEKKPRPKPGEIRETKALDGSTLYLCPECQMAYPDRTLIEQHVISHAVERRFICDICNAALKRKDHLTRHKLSHIPDRPHVCNVSIFQFNSKFSCDFSYLSLTFFW